MRHRSITIPAKQPSKKWGRKDEASLMNVNIKLSASKGTVLGLQRDFIHEERTVNAFYHYKLLDKVKAACWSKDMAAMSKYDNNRPLTAALTQEKLNKFITHLSNNLLIAHVD